MLSNILVTGGAGFIGSAIVDLCLAHRNNVVIIDSFLGNGHKNINPWAKLYEMDIRSPAIIEIFRKEKIEYVFHLAAQIDVAQSISSPYGDADVNIMGTLNILEACRKTNAKKIIFSSSAAVYGIPSVLPIDEEHPVEPLSCYGLSKLTGERYIELYHRLYNLEYIILRYANVYGPRQAATGDGGVVSCFLQKALKNCDITIYGDGKQTRDFIHLKDVAKANYQALISAKASNQVINISTGQPTSINTLWALIAEIVNCSSNCIFNKERPGDIKESYLGNKKAADLLSWHPEIPLEKGLKMTLNHQ